MENQIKDVFVSSNLLDILIRRKVYFYNYGDKIAIIGVYDIENPKDILHYPVFSPVANLNAIIQGLKAFENIVIPRFVDLSRSDSELFQNPLDIKKFKEKIKDLLRDINRTRRELKELIDLIKTSRSQRKSADETP